ncbi:MAG: alkene reductase [Leptospiraceae bacterium]|nr:alkene reductase [Leptospiraceae bacterium]MCP5497280.1 alkene reductase [Leptospiraceae bacterium]
MNTQKLLSNYSLAGLELQNKIVMAPMTRSRAIKNIPNELMATYYGQRNTAGLIITEGTSPSPNGLGYPRIPGVFSKEQVEGWKLVTQAVHKGGAKIFIQLMHTGRVSHKENLPPGAEVVSPSSKIVSGEMYVDGKGALPHTEPKEMTQGDIQHAIEEYVKASKNAIEAGFDGIELHGANGYLIEQFLNANINNRTDGYGGSIENRCKFALEIAKSVVVAIGHNKVGIRLSPYGVFNDTGAFAEVEGQYTYLVKELNKIGIAYIHIVDHSAMGAPEVPESIKSSVRKNFSGTYILSGGYDANKAEKDLEDGKGDLVAFGRPFIGNPDLVDRIRKGIEWNMNLDMNTFYTPGEKGYTDYPFS